MSSFAFIPPAHFDLLPRKMDFNLNVTDVFCKHIPEIDIKQVYKAENYSPGNFTGYYKIKTRSGGLFFAKVKSANRSKREALASEISTALFHKGVSSLPLQDSPRALPGGEWLFLYPWVDSYFYDGKSTQIINLGRELAILHNTLNLLPVAREKRKNIIDIWKERFALVPDAPFAAAYAVNLHLSESILSDHLGCLAHNDLHRANVLFTKKGELAAFVDFEDAVGITSSVLVDLSAVIERFCLLPKMNLENVSLFLANYLEFTDQKFEIHASELVQIGLCRCFHSLAILHSSPDGKNPNWQSEAAKFERLIENWKSLRIPFLQALDNY